MATAFQRRFFFSFLAPQLPESWSVKAVGPGVGGLFFWRKQKRTGGKECPKKWYSNNFEKNISLSGCCMAQRKFVVRAVAHLSAILEKQRKLWVHLGTTVDPISSNFNSETTRCQHWKHKKNVNGPVVKVDGPITSNYHVLVYHGPLLKFKLSQIGSCPPNLSWNYKKCFKTTPRYT